MNSDLSRLSSRCRCEKELSMRLKLTMNPESSRRSLGSNTARFRPETTCTGLSFFVTIRARPFRLSQSQHLTAMTRKTCGSGCKPMKTTRAARFSPFPTTAIFRVAGGPRRFSATGGPAHGRPLPRASSKYAQTK